MISCYCHINMILLIFLLYINITSCFLPLFNKNNKVDSFILKPIEKLNKKPVLIVNEPINNCNVRLVGVSHGSPASADLVREIITSYPKKPKAVVLELCDDRFLSISLDAKIQPRNNITLIDFYNHKMNKIKLYETQKLLSNNINDKYPFISRIFSAIRFAQSQGLVGGVFVIIGLVVSSMQRLFHSPTGDEFVTAMKLSEELDIPIRLGDAPQADTLNSIKRLISTETFQLNEIITGAEGFLFSSLGLLYRSSNKRIDDKLSIVSPQLLDQSKWISIPTAYFEDPLLIRSLLPLLAVLLLSFMMTITSSFADTPQIDVSSIDLSTTSLGIENNKFIETIISLFNFFITGDLSSNFTGYVDLVIDLFGLLLLIRMGKLIGTDRDRIIASKIQETCKLYPGSDIVVVIGMLHCNGVARWLISGLDPTQSSTDKNQ